MEIVIDVGSDVPMFAQLINQIKTGVVDGVLKPGRPLSSIRQIANDLGINQNTVAKAFRLLERDQVIVAKGYKGTFIHSGAVSNCKTDLVEIANSVIRAAIGSLREKGLTDSEIRIAFSLAMKNQIG